MYQAESNLFADSQNMFDMFIQELIYPCNNARGYNSAISIQFGREEIVKKTTLLK